MQSTIWRKVRLILLAVTIVAGSVWVLSKVLMVLAGLMFVFTLGSDDRPSLPDAELIADFQANRAKYDSLVTLFWEDIRITLVEPSYAKPEGALPPQRQRLYTGLLKDLDLRRIESCGVGCIFFVSSLSGNAATRGEIKGYQYRPRHPEPLYRNLDSLAPAQGSREGYRKIDDDWYLYYFSDY